MEQIKDFQLTQNSNISRPTLLTINNERRNDNGGKKIIRLWEENNIVSSYILRIHLK